MSTWYGTRWYDTKTSDVGLLPLSKAFADHDKVKVELRIIDEIFGILYGERLKEKIEKKVLEMKASINKICKEIDKLASNAQIS